MIGIDTLTPSAGEADVGALGTPSKTSWAAATSTASGRRVRITRVLTGYEYAMVSPTLALIAAVAATAAGMAPRGIAPAVVRVAAEWVRGGPPTAMMAGLPAGVSPIAGTAERSTASAVARTAPAHG